MARLAGMTLRERWSDWNRAPFSSDSRKHISVWEKDRSGEGERRRSRELLTFESHLPFA